MSNRVACPFCPKTYSNVGNMNKHKRKCPERGKIKDDKDMMILEMRHEMNEMKHEIKTLKKQMQAIQISQSVNLTVNNIHQEVHGNINMNILHFGSKDEMKKVDFSLARQTLMENPQEYIPNMIRHVHNNSQIPENQNVVYDPSSQTIHYFDDGKWIPAPDTNNMTKKLADKVRNTDFLNGMMSKFPDGMEAKEAMEIACKVNKKIGPLGLYDPLLPENSQKICASLKKK